VRQTKNAPGVIFVRVCARERERDSERVRGIQFCNFQNYYCKKRETNLLLFAVLLLLLRDDCSHTHTISRTFICICICSKQRQTNKQILPGSRFLALSQLLIAFYCIIFVITRPRGVARGGGQRVAFNYLAASLRFCLTWLFGFSITRGVWLQR